MKLFYPNFFIQTACYSGIVVADMSSLQPAAGLPVSAGLARILRGGVHMSSIIR
ncbi:MAG: hypothetical protein HUK21_11530 [Fibrobacteraceae bacterium]|nr:hypothetical protein [Fibrobacteraceae bacterium]